MMTEKRHIRYGLKFAKGGGTLTIERLRQVLSYDPETGKFTWLVSTARRIRVGDEAGSITEHGYRIIRIDREAHYAHRLAWFFAYGEYGHNIDHIDGDTANNRIENLRSDSHQRNIWNAKRNAGTSGYVGVWPTKDGKFTARIGGAQGQYLGTFDAAADAARAYDSAVRSLRGCWGRFNFPEDGEREVLR